MPTDVIMPQMGESIFEDEPLFEISTDKVDAEIPAPVAGVLAEIKVPEGATVVVNTVVAVIGTSGGTSGAGSGASGAGASAQAAATSPASTTAEAVPVASVPPASAPAASSAATEPSAAQQTELTPPQVEQVAGRRLRSSPLVRRIAKENQLDLGQIAGSGL
jgi:2-oxoglutarate dehydrogenase E2 component (dihydrolipoamide succinyltransferase)